MPAIMPETLDFLSFDEISHVMGKLTIVEFVEDEAILNALHELGVDCSHCYGIGRPQRLDAEAVTADSAG